MIEIYKNNILKFVENKIEIISISSDITLKLEVDTKSHMITSVSYNESNIDDIMKGILNAFCSVIINLPIIEASNHGVLRLEYLLRDASKKPIDGIITPNNTLKEFLILQDLIRDCFKQYKQKIKNAPTGNAYIVASVKEWVKLSDNIKKEKLNELIDSYFKDINQNDCDYSISVIKPMRVEFLVYNESLKNVGHFLLELEKYIQKVLKVPIEVMYTEKIDNNRVRQKSRK